MKFVIVGYGRVGSRTARVLQEEGHEVVVVEVHRERIDRVRKAGIAVIEGDGGEEDVLTRARLTDADAVAGLTGDLHTNFAACSVGKHYDCRTVMRIDEDYRQDVYRQYADDVDEVVYPERLGAIGAKNALLGGTIRAVADVAPNLQVVELTVTPEAPMRGYTVSELQLPADATVLAFGKGEGPLVLPDPDESIEAGDRLVVLADFDVLDDVRQIVVGDDRVEVAEGGA